jgi:hypothetical protein
MTELLQVGNRISVIGGTNAGKIGEVASIGRVFVSFWDDDSGQKKKCKKSYARKLEEAQSVQLVSSDEEDDPTVQEIVSKHLESLITALATATILAHDPRTRTWEEQKQLVGEKLLRKLSALQITTER